MIRVALLALVSVQGLAQSVAAPPAFEVATVRLHEGPGRIELTTSGPRLTATAKTVVGLLSYAYDVRTYQIALTPALKPFEDEFYDIAATAGSGATPSGATPTPAEFRLMLRQLLAERFSLTVHSEPREIGIYALVQGSSGPKFKPSVPGADSTPHVTAAGRNRDAIMLAATMEDLILAIDNSLPDRPVIDRTGLTGTFSIRLVYTPATNANRRNPDAEDIDIFTAVRALGLRLEPQKGLFGMLVVDRMEKPRPE